MLQGWVERGSGKSLASYILDPHSPLFDVVPALSQFCRHLHNKADKAELRRLNPFFSRGQVL